MTDPMGMSESYVYDDAGNMIQKTDRNGTVLKYDYDAMNRITKEYAKAGTSEVIKSTYKYDVRNNLVEMNNGESAIAMFYSERNLLNKTYLYQNSERYDIYCNYDKRGQVYDKYIYKYKSSGDEKLAGYKYTYDNNGNVTNIKYNGDGSSIYNDLEGYTYDNCDRVTKETRGSITTDYTYNMAGLVTGMTNKKGASVLSTYSNTYNYDGNVAKAVENGVTKNYTYDYMNRLVYENTKENSYEYFYDKAGNREKTLAETYIGDSYSVYYKYDKNNRLLNETKDCGNDKYYVDYTYDNNGNRRSKMKSESHLDTTDKQALGIKTATELTSNKQCDYYIYNVFNQLVDYRATYDRRTVYWYLPNGYRYKKNVNGKVTSYVWDGDNVAAETDTNGEVTRTYFRGKSSLALDTDGNNYVYDIHGSVTSIVNSGGTKSKEYEYNAFGKKESETNKNTSNPFRTFD